MNNSDFENLLFTYVECALKCERMLMYKFDLENIPYREQRKIPKSDQFEIGGVQFQYLFHGISCKFSIDGIVLDYDVYLDRKDYIVTSPWKLMLFVNSIESQEKITEVNVAFFLEELDERGIVTKVLGDYSIYAISLNWYYSLSINHFFKKSG